MKILPFVTSLLVLLLSITPVAFAQINLAVTSTSPTRATLREELHTNRQAARDAFKQKLTTIKDERKQALVEKIDTSMQEINSRRTTQMTAALTRLSTIIDHVASKAGDNVEAKAAVATAQTAIATAKQAVAAQLAKDYVITITGETTLGQAVKTTIQSLRTDLQATHAIVVSAQQAVIQAIKFVQKEQQITPTQEAESN